MIHPENGDKVHNFEFTTVIPPKKCPALSLKRSPTGDTYLAAAVATQTFIDRFEFAPENASPAPSLM